jgi:hypothetical protein
MLAWDQVRLNREGISKAERMLVIMLPGVEASRRLHAARAGGRAGRPRARGDFRAVWAFMHAEQLSFKKPWWLANAIVPTWRASVRNGQYLHHIDPTRQA